MERSADPCRLVTSVVLLIIFISSKSVFYGDVPIEERGMIVVTIPIMYAPKNLNFNGNLKRANSMKITKQKARLDQPWKNNFLNSVFVSTFLE